MFENLQQRYKRYRVDFFRIGIIGILVLVLGSLDGLFQISESNAYQTALISSTSLVLIVAAMSHLTRRILFPDLDLNLFAKEALFHPVGAAIVFCSICMVVTALIVANVMLLS